MNKYGLEFVVEVALKEAFGGNVSENTSSGIFAIFPLEVIERFVNAERVEDLISVFGSFDENIARIEQALCVSIINRDTELKVTGDEEYVLVF